MAGRSSDDLLAMFDNAPVGGGFPLFVILVAFSAFFVEGGFSNLAPYTVEQYGVGLGSRSSGLAPETAVAAE